jgi:hypothetical protein
LTKPRTLDPRAADEEALRPVMAGPDCVRHPAAIWYAAEHVPPAVRARIRPCCPGWVRCSSARYVGRKERKGAAVVLTKDSMGCPSLRVPRSDAARPATTTPATEPGPRTRRVLGTAPLRV